MSVNETFFLSLLLWSQIRIAQVTRNMFVFFYKAARLKINEEFRKNKNETSEENIQKVLWSILIFENKIDFISLLLLLFFFFIAD